MHDEQMFYSLRDIWFACQDAPANDMDDGGGDKEESLLLKIMRRLESTKDPSKRAALESKLKKVSVRVIHDNQQGGRGSVSPPILSLKRHKRKIFNISHTPRVR